MDSAIQSIVFRGMPTPWGDADRCEQILDGIGWVSTPSHGGIHLSEERNSLIPHDLLRDHFNLQRREGWYEEDCDAAIVICVFEAEIARNAIHDHHIQMSKGVRHWDCLKRWQPPALQYVLALSARLKDELELTV